MKKRLTLTLLILILLTIFTSLLNYNSKISFAAGTVDLNDLVPDIGLRELINRELKKTDLNGKISKEDLEKLTRISPQNNTNKVTSIEGLQYALNLNY